MSSFTIALAGNPNAGKTTLFNALTGASQRVGNWPGVTVERKEGFFELSTPEKLKLSLIDLPGVYSFEQQEMGVDEQIARTYLSEHSPDLILNIVDASNLERNLLLTHQLNDLGIPMIVILNMMDVAKAEGVTIDVEKLSKGLNLRVIPIVASKGRGLSELKSQISNELLSTQKVTRQASEVPQYTNAAESTLHRIAAVRSSTEGAVSRSSSKTSMTHVLDGIVLNRWLGVPIFFAMMYLMFTLAINLGAVFIDFFDILFGAVFVDGTSAMLNSINAPAWLNAILADGLGGGIQLVATFVPVIGFLYICLSVLEDSGYMARAAFVIDRVMRSIGLPGNAFVPLIVGFGCNVPSVMAARTLNREQDRLLTVAMSPFMSCGARLTVYALFAAAFFPDNGSLIVFALYVLGIVMAVFTGWIFKKSLFQGELSPSYQEMPTYHLPVLRNLLLTTWNRLKSFIFRAGKTIVIVVVVLSFLNSWGTDGSFGNQNSKHSVLSEIGRTITPAFAPIGLKDENWPATVGIFTGIFAKEAVVGTLDALYSGLGGENALAEEELSFYQKVESAFVSVGDNIKGLADAFVDPLGLGAIDTSDKQAAAVEQDVSIQTFDTMEALFSGTFGAFCYLVFILLYTPCVAVMGAMARESGIKWMGLVALWSTSLAYWAAANIYQLGTWSEAPASASITLLIVNGLFVLLLRWLRMLGQKALGATPDLIPLRAV